MDITLNLEPAALPRLNLELGTLNLELGTIVNPCKSVRICGPNLAAALLFLQHFLSQLTPINPFNNRRRQKSEAVSGYGIYVSRCQQSLHPIYSVHIYFKLIPGLSSTPASEHIPLSTEIQHHLRNISDAVSSHDSIKPQFDILTHPVSFIIPESFIKYTPSRSPYQTLVMSHLQYQPLDVPPDKPLVSQTA